MSTVTPNFAPGSDTAALNPALKQLVSRPEAPWRLTATGEGVERSFRFKTFAKTWVSSLSLLSLYPVPGPRRAYLGDNQDFMTAVSLQCKIKNHHPEWSNVGFSPSHK